MGNKTVFIGTKIIALFVVALMICSLGACGASAKDYVPETVTSVNPNKKNDVYKFNGEQKGQTMIYTMTQEGKDPNVYGIPDKVFAPFLGDAKKGKINGIILSELNYQYEITEWSAYFFHNILFAFSDAALNGTVNKFQIKRENETPFFTGTVQLGENKLPKIVKISLLVPPDQADGIHSGIDSATYSFAYNQKRNITHVNFEENSTWNDWGQAEINVKYEDHGKKIKNIHKQEYNTASKKMTGITICPKYGNIGNSKIESMIVTQDTILTDPNNNEKHRPEEIMDFNSPFHGRYTGYSKGRRYRDNRAEHSHTSYEYEKGLIAAVKVTDTTRDNRTYTYMKI